MSIYIRYNACTIAGRVSAEKSLFLPSSRRKRATDNDVYEPIFLDDLKRNVSTEDPVFYKNATSRCGESIECLFDALVTKNEAIGESSKKSQDTFQKDQKAISGFFINYIFLFLTFHLQTVTILSTPIPLSIFWKFTCKEDTLRLVFLNISWSCKHNVNKNMEFYVVLIHLCYRPTDLM